MSHYKYRPIICAALFALATMIPAAAAAQTVGADEYEAPADAQPGEANLAPSTDIDPGDAVHSSEAAPPPAAPQLDVEDGSLSVTVQIRHANDDDVDLSGMPVTLEALRPPGPMQPDNFRQIAAQWVGVTDASGLARFDELPDTLARQGLVLQASTSFGGLAFESSFAAPRAGEALELVLYDRTHELPEIRLSRKRVIVSLWEEYLVFDQFWTFEIDGDYAFDIAASPDPALERGLEMRFPMEVEGISFAGPGTHEVIQNRVYWNHVLVPGQPVTVQVRFSKSARGSSQAYEQIMDFPVDEIQLLAAVDTPFQRIPRVDDLVLRAPGFEVGNDPGVLGLQTQNDYLVASGRSVDAGESYAFRLEGLPFRRPTGGWIALFGGLLMALLLAAFGAREHKRFHAARDTAAILRGLRARRDDLYEELALVEQELAQVEDEDLAFELEDERLIIRQRLTLILRKIDDLKNGTHGTTDQ